MKLKCQAIHGSWGKRVDISLESDTEPSLFNTWQESRLSVKGIGKEKKIDSSARGSGADVRRIIKEEELRQ